METFQNLAVGIMLLVLGIALVSGIAAPLVTHLLPKEVK